VLTCLIHLATAPFGLLVVLALFFKLFFDPAAYVTHLVASIAFINASPRQHELLLKTNAQERKRKKREEKKKQKVFPRDVLLAPFLKSTMVKLIVRFLLFYPAILLGLVVYPYAAFCMLFSGVVAALVWVPMKAFDSNPRRRAKIFRRVSFVSKLIWCDLR